MLSRRKFLQSSGVAAGLSLLPESWNAAEAMAPEQPGSTRSLPMNRGWLFKPAVTAGDTAAEFDDSGFERVVVPHTNKVLPWHSFDDVAYEFVSTYRRHFRVPAEARGKRVFVDFEGAMTASTVFINGHELGEYKGGYTPFSFELTPHLRWDGSNVLAVHLDSTERSDIPPFGYEIDYLTFGGIYREVALRIVPQVFLDNVFVRTIDPLSGHPGLEVECFLEGAKPGRQRGSSLRVELRDGGRVVGSQTAAVDLAPGSGGLLSQVVRISGLQGIELWSLKHPKLYTVHVTLLRGDQVEDADMRRIGFRDAKFTPGGFSLNGEIIKLRGLDRHQTFPWVGQAMPGRVQRRDAHVLHDELKCNIVRTSHYPQSRHFLDACDEIGLLVLEEIPGWQHIGDAAWKQIAVDNVRRMIRRDWNHPSIVLWGVRINESKDDHDFYTQTNAVAHALDHTRQTGGIRNSHGSELLEDVFTINDFGFPLKPPSHPLYLNTEFCGHTFPTRSTDNSDRQREHTVRHARVHDQIASDAQYAGGIGWCAFDYNTHNNFGSGDRICYHGVSDIFRLPKLAAGFYRSQCDPDEEVVLEPAFHWARNDENSSFTVAMVCSNCDHLKFFVDTGKGFHQFAEADPDRKQFAHLRYPPFYVHFDGGVLHGWGDLRIEGYRNGKKVIERTMSGRGTDHSFRIVADDNELIADGADTTRITLRVLDPFGNVRYIAGEAIQLELSGPARLIGDNPFPLVAGVGAVWVRALEQPGTVTLKATHPYLGTQTLRIEVAAAKPETV